MTIDWVRAHCLGLPQVTEDVKWENYLIFSIGGKMFAAVNLEPGTPWMSFKCTPEEFAELSERPGCRPAPYLARAHWVALDHPDARDGRGWSQWVDATPFLEGKMKCKPKKPKG